MKPGQKITALRKDKGLLQSDVAKAVGVSLDAKSKYERGGTVPTVENAKKMADVLGASLDYLMSEDDTQERIENCMLHRIREIQRLAQDDLNTIVNVIDAFIRDTKTKKVYAQ